MSRYIPAFATTIHVDSEFIAGLRRYVKLSDFAIRNAFLKATHEYKGTFGYVVHVFRWTEHGKLFCQTRWTDAPRPDYPASLYDHPWGEKPWSAVVPASASTVSAASQVEQDGAATALTP